MRRSVLTALAALVVPMSAHAQAGLYMGINGTYALEGTLQTWQAGSGREAIKPTGSMVGLQIGYNYMLTDTLVVGAEADYQIISASGKEGYLACPAAQCGMNITQTNTVDVRNAGTVRARVGYKSGKYMPYLTGGYAYGNALVHASFGGALPDIKQHVNPTGWVVGAGLDYWLNENWSMRTEYVYSQLGDGSMRFRANIVRFGVNYLF